MNYSDGGFAFFAFFTSGIFLFILGMLIVTMVANWKVYEKAGVAGWKALIPILNMWEMLKIAGLNPLMILLMFVPIVNGFIGIYFAFKFVESYGFGVGGFILYMIAAPFMTLYMGFSSEVEYVGNYYEG